MQFSFKFPWFHTGADARYAVPKVCIFMIGGSGCILVRARLDGLTRLRDVLTGSRRGVTGTQERRGTQKCE
jgi:hypothetical protein